MFIVPDFKNKSELRKAIKQKKIVRIDKHNQILDTDNGLQYVESPNPFIESSPFNMIQSKRMYHRKWHCEVIMENNIIISVLPILGKRK